MVDFKYTPIRMLVVCSNFCRSNEPIEPYGVSCLVGAFKSNPQNAGDVLDVFTCDLNRFHNPQADQFSIDPELIADEIVSKVQDGQYNVVAFSVFGWFEKEVQIASIRLAQQTNPPFIMMGGSSIMGSENELRKRFPFADMFTLSYGEKIFANPRNYICSGLTRVLELPDFNSLKSPYLTGAIPLNNSITVARAETRRGCPFRCSFCKHRDTLSGKVHPIGCARRHLEEIRLFKSKNIQRLNILDPLFNDYQGFGTQYLKLLREEHFEGLVTLQIRPEFLSDSFLEEAAQNNNLRFEIGVQSLQADVLKVINRGAGKTQTQLLEKLDKCKHLGITTMVTLIYGLPLQTYQSFAQDIELIQKHGVSKIEAFPLQVYPSTKLYADIEQYHMTIAEDCFGIAEVVDNPTHDFDKMNLLAHELN